MITEVTSGTMYVEIVLYILIQVGILSPRVYLDSLRHTFVLAQCQHGPQLCERIERFGTMRFGASRNCHKQPIWDLHLSHRPLVGFGKVLFSAWLCHAEALSTLLMPRVHFLAF